MNTKRRLAGATARPLEFPTPKVCRCEERSLSVLDHRNGRIHSVKRVLVYQTSSGNRRAVAIKKKLAKSTYGFIYLGVILRRISEYHPSVQWESTGELVSIKSSSFQEIDSRRGKLLDDPVKEIAALKHLGTYQKNVLGCIEALEDDDNLYCISRYCSGGDLYGRLMGNPKTPGRPDEYQVRIWFRDLLCGLSHLQQKGVCHRNIALENLVLDDQDNLVIGDFGLALRVPYVDKSSPESVCDISEGTVHRRMPNQGVCGNLMYLAPEVIQGSDVDGYALDVWSSGVLLFVMLVGMAPFRWAHVSDLRYLKVSKGHLKDLVREQGILLSDSALNLLQKMLQPNPRKRPSISDILSHPWMREGDLLSAGSHMKLDRIRRKSFFQTFPLPPPPPTLYESPAPLDFKGLLA